MYPTTDTYPLLLCVPGIDGPAIEQPLRLAQTAYEVIQDGDLWKVIVGATGEVIYAGPGPAVIRRSLAPF